MSERMVMTRAPLGITFVGGGTDLPFYQEKRGFGAVVSDAINKYIYVTANRKFDDNIRVSYSKTEIVDSVEKIEDPTVREANEIGAYTLALTGMDGGKLRNEVGHCIRVKSNITPIIREVHIAIIHIICYSFDAMLE